VIATRIEAPADLRGSLGDGAGGVGVVVGRDFRGSAPAGPPGGPRGERGRIMGRTAGPNLGDTGAELTEGVVRGPVRGGRAERVDTPAVDFMVRLAGEGAGDSEEFPDEEEVSTGLKGGSRTEAEAGLPRRAVGGKLTLVRNDAPSSESPPGGGPGGVFP